MSTELIELQDGLLVEISANPDDEPRQIAANALTPVDGAIDQAHDILLKASKPVASVWTELNRDLSIEQVEIELALGFEATGKMFIAEAKGSANLKFKLIVRPSGRE